MATVNVSGPQFQINGQNTYVLGSPERGFVGTYAIKITNDGVLTGQTITVKARPVGTTATFVPVPYTARYTGGAVGSDAVLNTALSLDCLILVNAAGQDIALDVTAYTSGSATATFGAVAGAAA